MLNEPEGDAPTSFAARFVRVDGESSCPVLDDSPVNTSAADFLACRTIPADQHATRDNLGWRLTSGTGGAYLSVFGSDGTRYCGPTLTAAEHTSTCRMPAGPATVYLDAAGTDATYQITRAGVPAVTVGPQPESVRGRRGFRWHDDDRTHR